VQFGDELGDGEQLGNGRERVSQEILVEACDDDAHAAVGEILCEGNDFGVEELCLVDAHDMCRREVSASGGIGTASVECGSQVADDMFWVIAGVDTA
jgi:hypothetical protein